MYKIEILPCCHSTNSVAWEGVANGRYSHGWMVYTPEQTKGRGRGGNTWQSEPHKNATFSLVVEISHVNNAFLQKLNLWVCVWLCRFLQKELIHYPQTAQALQIKWPNDLWIHAQKIGGILIESRLKPNNDAIVVLGVGLNVNQTEFGYLNATSLVLQTGKDWLIMPLLMDLHTRIFRDFETEIHRPYHHIKEQYLHLAIGHSHAMLFKNIKEGEEFYAYLKDLTPDDKIGLMPAGTPEIIYFNASDIKMFGNKPYPK